MDYKLSCSSLYEDEQYYWFSEWNFNGFYQVEKATLKAKLLFHFPGEDLDREQLHIQIERVGDWLVLCPRRGKEITAYHRETGELKRFPLKENLGKTNIHYARDFKFFFQCSHKNQVYFFPATYPAVVILNLDTMLLTYQENEVKEMGERTKTPSDKEVNMYFGIGQKKGHKVYLPVACASLLGVYDMETNQLHFIPAKGETRSFFSAEVVGERCYLGDRAGNGVACYDEVTEEWNYLPFYATMEQRTGKFKVPYRSSFLHGTQLYLYPWSGNDRFQMNLETGEIKQSQFLIELLSQNHVYPYCSFCNMLCLRVEGDIVSFVNGKNGDWYEVNLVTEEWSTKSILADPIGRKILSEKVWYGVENYNTNLESYLAFVKNIEEKEDANVKTKTIGQAIFEATT